MIELAPRHKIGFPIHTPVLLAGGSIGYGEAVHRGLDLAAFGAAVVGPITRRPLIGSDTPRLAESSGGFVLETGLQNRGSQAVMKKFARLWPRLGTPVIAQVADSDPTDAASTVRRLMESEAVMGLELLLAHGISPDRLRELVAAIRRESPLPLWIKPVLEQASVVAPLAAELGVDGLVVGQPLRGAGVQHSALVTGRLYGPLSFAPMLATLHDVARLALPLTLVACGGIHSPAQAEQALKGGATAIQLDSLLWVEPGAAQALARDLAVPL